MSEPIKPSRTTQAFAKAQEVDAKVSRWIDSWNPYTPE